MGRTVRFLSPERVRQVHEFSLLHTGGASGVRDTGLLKSAALTPQQEFGGVYLHEGLAAKAAAYLFHLAANHPFIDGNKRTAVLAALVFLDVNGVRSLPAPEILEPVVWRVAEGTMSKQELTTWFIAQGIR